MKAHMTLAGSLMAALILTAGCGGGGDGGTDGSSDPSNASVAAGKVTFSKICSACHGMDGKGMPSLGKDITTSTFVASDTDEQLLAFIKEGRAADHPDNTTGVPMPPKAGDPTLTDAKILEVIAYMRSIQVKP